MLRLAINGALGRMGRAVGRLARESADVALAAAIEPAGSADLGKDYGTLLGGPPLGVPVSASLAARCDALIDFSAPEAALQRVAECRATKTPAVICTTGFRKEGREALAAASKEIPLLVASNTSPGIAALERLLPDLARRLGDEYDIEIVERHHRRKKDAPSGTAISLAEAIQLATGRRYPEDFVFGRHGLSGEKPPRQIGMHAVRAGGIVGEHAVLFASEDETIEVIHRVGGRDVFARGALQAARFVAQAAPGMYAMRDIPTQPSTR